MERKSEKWDETEIELSFSDSYILLLRQFSLFFASREEIISSSSSPHKFYPYQTDWMDVEWVEGGERVRIWWKKDISESIRLIHTCIQQMSRIHVIFSNDACPHVFYEKKSHSQKVRENFLIWKGSKLQLYSDLWPSIPQDDSKVTKHLSFLEPQKCIKYYSMRVIRNFFKFSCSLFFNE